MKGYSPVSANDDLMRLIIDKANPDNRVYMDVIYTAAAALRAIGHSPNQLVTDKLAAKALDVIFNKLIEGDLS